MSMFLVLLILFLLAAVAYRKLRSGRRRGVLVPNKFLRLKLKEKIKVSHNSYIFRFALPNATDTLGLPIGQHIALRAVCDVKKELTREDGTRQLVTQQELVKHSYTPISSDDDKGYVDFMIKVYVAGVDKTFPAGGRLSQHLFHLSIGKSVELMGPTGHFTYHLNGRFSVEKNTRQTASTTRSIDAFAMIAGGTGITPMLQIIRAIHKSASDHTKVYLVYCNKTEDDILLRKELDELAAQAPDQFHMYYTLTQQAPPHWRFGTGRVDAAMLRKHLPIPGADGERVQALLCGPPAMLSQAVRPNLLEIGYTADDIFAF